MDYTAEIENVKTQLLNEGFTQEKLNQLIDLAAQEALDMALDELKEKDDAVLDEMGSKMQNAPTTQEEAIAQLNLVFQNAYGDNYENKKLELIYNYLKEALDQTVSAKNLYQRYQAGDPSAVAFIKSQEGNPDVQKLAQAFIDENK